jgi:AraC-like DNA-binding protein
MTDNTPGRLCFETDALPERDRFPAFCEGIFRHVVGADVARLGSLPFHGRLSVRLIGGVRIADIATTSAEIIRDTRHTSDGDDDIVVQLWQEGLADATQGEQQSQIKPREGFVIDNTRAARVCTGEKSRFFALMIPRSRITNLKPDVDRFVGTKLRDGFSLRFLLEYLEGTSALDLDEHSAAARCFGDHLVDLVAFVLGGEVNTGEGELEARGGVRAARLAAILRTILQQSADLSLSAGTIAAQMGITPRYVHLLLEETGRSFTQHVLERRLERAAALLRDPRRLGRRIADIALESGFADLSQFNRAFRRRFGDTPSGIRAEARRSSDER